MLETKIFFLVAIIVCVTAISCGDSDTTESTQTATSTDTAPLTVPGDGTPGTTTTLFDMWVIDSINGKAPDSGYFSLGNPYFDFNAEKNTISGFTGCNGINGKVIVKDQQVKFDSLSTSSQACSGKGKEFEKRLLAGFKSGKTTYRIQNEKLYLDLGNGSNLIFRKIRR